MKRSRPEVPLISQYQLKGNFGPIVYEGKSCTAWAAITIPAQTHAINVVPIRFKSKKDAVSLTLQGGLLSVYETNERSAVFTFGSLKRDGGYIPLKRKQCESDLQLSVKFGSLDDRESFEWLWRNNYGVWVEQLASSVVLHFSDAKDVPNFDHAIVEIRFQTE